MNTVVGRIELSAGGTAKGTCFAIYSGIAISAEVVSAAHVNVNFLFVANSTLV